MRLSRGYKLGPYEILAPIAAGGMGEVYKAADPRLDRIVAIKLADEKFSDRFQREARAIAALNHPNICQIYDVGPNYIVMEFVEGEPVAPPDSVRKLLDVAVQIADGLAAAHTLNLVHRDLKPGNILLTRDGRVKILDFGLAKRGPSIAKVSPDDPTRTDALTEPGSTVGTVAYMSPEQARGAGELTIQSDQFSFGLVLYELAAGKRPFQRASTPETMAAIIREDPAPLPALLPPPLRWAIERLLAKDPSDRYDTTRDLARGLRQIRDQLSEIVTTAAKPSTAKLRSRRALFVAPLFALAGFLAAALWPVPPAGAPKLTPFATESEIETMPAWSPKGDRIAFIADDHGILQVFSQSLGGRSRTQVTHQKQWCTTPAWSADGTRIYFVSAGTLYSGAVAGGEAQPAVSGILRAAVSPDAKTLAVLVNDPDHGTRLAFSSPPGAPPKLYTQAPFDSLFLGGSGSSLVFTPDSQSLGLVVGAFSGAAQLWMVPVDGSAPRQTRYSGGSFVSFNWMPDGRRIVRGSTGSSESHLILEDVRLGVSHPLTSGGGYEGFPAISPDASAIAFAAGESQYNIIEVPLDSSPIHNLLPLSRQSVAPAWAPDGVHFAYVTNRNGPFEIWLRNVADGGERRIVSTTDFGPDVYGFLDCAISPDGSRIAYRIEGRRHEIWISPLSGEAPVRLLDPPRVEGQRGPAWSPDGNWIAYYSLYNGKVAVVKARVGAGSPPELVAYTSSLQMPAWSPRGDLIAFRDGNQMRVAAPDGKNNSVISQSGWAVFGWSTDGASVIGISLDGNRHSVVKRATISTSREEKISDLGPVPAAFDLANAQGTYWYRNFSLHPNGKSFLTSVYNMQVHLWLMRDFNRPTRLLFSWFSK